MDEQKKGHRLFPSLDKPPHDDEVVPVAMEIRMTEKRDALIVARDQLRLQLNGIENQIYILNQLLNPQPEEVPDGSINGVPMEDGTV